MKTTSQGAAVTVRKVSLIGAPDGHRTAEVASAQPIAVLPEYVVSRWLCQCGRLFLGREQLVEHHDLAALGVA